MSAILLTKNSVAVRGLGGHEAAAGSREATFGSVILGTFRVAKGYGVCSFIPGSRDDGQPVEPELAGAIRCRVALPVLR